VKVLIFARDYDPASPAAPTRAYVAAQKFASSGFNVDVITGFPQVRAGEAPSSGRGKLLSFDRDGLVHVTRLRRYAPASGGTFGRAIGWFSTAFGALVAGALKLNSVDAVCVSMPSDGFSLAALASSFLGSAHLFVDDAGARPQARVDAGAGRFDRWFAGVTAATADRAYRRARTVFCASEEARAALAGRCGPQTEVLVAPGGFERVEPAAARAFERNDGEFVVTYAGNMGAESGLDLLLDAARELRGDAKFRFVLIGDGSEAPRLRDRIATEGLANVSFLGILEHAVSLAAFRESDLAVVMLRADAVKCVPSKMFDALSVACPLLLSGRGDAERFVEEAGAGWCVPPEDAAALAAAIRTASSGLAACRSRGKAGRKFALANYDRDRIALNVVRNVFAATSPAVNRRGPVFAEANYGGASDS